jgi:tetratricopeptide (TPR) repeat protein
MLNTSTNRMRLLFGGFAAAVLLAYVMGLPPADTSPHVATAPAEALEPSKDNVDPAVHVQLMTLTQRISEAQEDHVHMVKLARLLWDSHRLAEAAEQFERYVKLNPTDRQAWLDLTNVYGQDRQWDLAKATSERMLERFPDDPSAMYNLGAIHANAGRFDEARSWWTRVRQQRADEHLAVQAATSLQRIGG